MIQQVLMYITLTIAFGYIVKKFFLPKSLFSSKKQKQKGCGSTDCGCN